jgi:hypothetical protein
MRPLKENLFAVIIVGIFVATFAIVCCGGGIMWTWQVAAKGDSTPAVTSANHKERERAADDDRMAKILNHAFWKKPPSREAIESAVREIARANSTTRVWIDCNGKFELESTLAVEDQINLVFVPNGIARPNVTFRIDVNFDSRPTSRQIETLILRRLDDAEFRNGPGR